MIILNSQINQILVQAVELEASDVHLTVGRPPVFRINGLMVPQDDYPCLSPKDTKDLLCQLTEESKSLKEKGELDFACSIPEVGRFRVNAFSQKGSIGIVIRLINSHVPTLEQLNLPPIVADFTAKKKGLVLVTGPTGSGKSTTLAAMIDKINSEQTVHILTLEDPIEYIHQHKKSVVNQREIGSDSKSFASALKAALRQDPDVILVGEMRDLETISIALTAAETGHLVFATLHTNNATQTIDRIIGVFPPHQQQQVRIQLAETLQGVIAQRLLPKADGSGRVAAVEILVSTAAVRNLIREGKTHQIQSVIQTGSRFGMQSMEMALKKLVQTGLITHEELTNHLSDEALKLD